MEFNEESYKRKLESFLEGNKTLIEAPAGYGKTHTIIRAVSRNSGSKKSLILTHTNAGVDSIRKKAQAEDLQNQKYHIQTICSYAEKYVNCFKGGYSEVEKEDLGGDYYTKIIKDAKKLLKNDFISNVLKITYSEVFVDEYQDCNKYQDSLIKEISKIIPVHILGDPLQGIFNFNNSLVNWKEIRNDFCKQELNYPWRWDDNKEFAEELISIRRDLEKDNFIDLKNYNECSSIKLIEVEKQKLHLKINEIAQECDELLVIHPRSEAFNQRLVFFKKLQPRFYFVESYYDDSFLNAAEVMDDLKNNHGNLIEALYEGFFIEHKIFNKGDLDNWFNKNSQLKNKRKEKDKKKIKPVKNLIKSCKVNFSFFKISEILKKFKKITSQCNRHDLFYSTVKALEIAEQEKISVEEAMDKILKISRRREKLQELNYIFATTLLMKGLEFNNVLILNPEEFKNKKNLYVAITRAKNNLFIIGENFYIDYS